MRIIPVIGLHTEGSLTALEGPRDFRRQSKTEEKCAGIAPHSLKHI